MNQEALLIFRLAATAIFLSTIIAGIYLFKNIEKLVPSAGSLNGENASQRTYAKFLVFAIWAHTLVLSGSFALLFH